VMLARAIDAGLDEVQPGARQARAARETAQANLAEARALVAALPPADLTEGGLLGALRRATDRCARENGVAAELSVRGTRARWRRRTTSCCASRRRRWPSVGKHSRARRRDDDDLGRRKRRSRSVTTVSGCRLGCQVASAWPACGSASRRAGGELCVEATPGGGTTVRVVLPSPFGAPHP
jgi:hypothetical protein